MKLLFLLGLLVGSTAYGQIDLPQNPEGNEEILSYLWEKHDANELRALESFQLLSLLDRQSLSLVEQLQVRVIEGTFSHEKDLEVIRISKLDESEAIKFISHESEVNHLNLEFTPETLGVLRSARKKINDVSKFEALSVVQVKELLLKTPDSAHYENGTYKDTPRLFLFCRESREFPCLFVMKDIFGNFITSNGKVWTLPALAKSARNLPYFKTNGQTPNGVHSMDSVMPEANRQGAFGKFRRVILNWIPKSKNESNVLHFLPKSHHKLKWWKRASIARDAGRRYLRIHGTGRVNDEPNLSYYPHIATSGCISTREGKYGGITYKDQRVILDKLMEASQLMPTFTNESKIKGIVYVVNIDSKKKAVKLEDLKKFGVE